MSEISLVYATAGAIAALFIFTLITCRFIYRRHKLKGVLPFLLLRLISSGLIIYLAWSIFADFEEAQKETKGTDNTRQLVVLQDRSRSMDLEIDGKSRNDLADEVWRQCSELAGKREHVEALRLLFAGNLVEEAEADRLRGDATQIGNALAGALSRYQMDALLIASDGAATDGAPPQYVLDWVQNRGIPIYAVNTSRPQRAFRDAYVLDVRCEQTNPEAISAVVGGRGLRGEKLTIDFLIDGQQVAVRNVDAATRSELRVDVPHMEKGWHEFAVEVSSPEGEVTTLNNRRLGVFRTVPPTKLLFLYNSPRLGDRHLVRFLDQMFPGQLDVMSVQDAARDDIRVASYALFIVGDVPHATMPKAILTRIQAGKAAVLVLTGRHLKDWSGGKMPGFPVHSVGKVRKLYDINRKPGVVLVDPDNNAGGFRRMPLDSLALYRIQGVSLHPAANKVISVQHGGKLYPLLVADQLGKPKQLALLSDTIWRWGMSPDTKVRSAYRAFWRRTLNWTMGIQQQDFELDLTLEADGHTSDMTQIHVSHINTEQTPDLKKVVVNSDVKNTDKVVKAALQGQKWTIGYPNPPKRPTIIWFQAACQYEGRLLQSMETPLVLNLDSRELLDTAPNPDQLRALVERPDEQVAGVEETGDLLNRLFDEIKAEPPPLLIRRRDWRNELILGVIILLVISLEWLLERALKERNG